MGYRWNQAVTMWSADVEDIDAPTAKAIIEHSPFICTRKVLLSEDENLCPFSDVSLHRSASHFALS